jgi:hypothetical protein
MNLAPPLSRPAGKRPVETRARTARRSPTQSTAKSRGGTLRRERHQPDYTILVAVVSLASIGILMVYSSSAMRGYLSSANDTFAIVGPQIQWALLGLLAMVAMMRVDYRYLRLVSVPFFVVAVALLVLVFVPQLNIVVGGSARWLRLGPLPAIHPAEIAKLALIIYLAHWMAKRGTRIRSLWGGTVPFLIIVLPVIALVFKEPDLGTTIVITLTAFTMFFVAGANLLHLGLMGAGALTAVVMVGLRGYQMDRIRDWLDPWADALGGPGIACARRGRADGDGAGRQPRVRAERIQRLHLRRRRAGVRLHRRGGRDRAVPRARLRWRAHLARGTGHVRGPAGGRDHRLAVPAGVHQHRRRRHPHPDHRHHLAVHQRGWLVAHHQLRGGRHPAVDLPRDRGEGNLERRCDC